MLKCLVRQGELTLEKDGKPVWEEGEVKVLVAAAVEEQLAQFARRALLVR